MSSLELRRSPLRVCLVVAALSLGLSGCFQPLYGVNSATASVASDLAAIDVAPVGDRIGQERIGHYLRQETQFELSGGVAQAQTRYRLEMSVNQRVDSAIVNTDTGRADAATIITEVTYTLKSLADDKVVTSGKAVASASYDRNPQRFATLRAARDAEIRLARQLAEQIRIRLASTLASRV
jgi:LPS-assembly lipoprotein